MRNFLSFIPLLALIMIIGSTIDVCDNTKEAYAATLNPRRFLSAAEHGDIATVKELLAEGVNINAANQLQGLTALILASHEGHADVVRELLDKGADVNMKDSWDKTALMFASDKDHKEIIELLRKHGGE